ncbi:MAG: lamin tail domain-containing protein [Candidatus Aenigmarchaeota archaeon]|nr:lamin tail domain-containing protein [Candidatus Aenigmarchaeota archaeon]
MYGKFLLIAIVVLFFLPKPIWNLQVSEIMYNPNCSNDLCEWVEIYNNGTNTDTSGWTFDSQPLGNNSMPDGSYLVITNRLTGNSSFESVWGNNNGLLGEFNYTIIELSISLRNTNDTLNLSNGIKEDIIFYESSYGANGNGKALCRGFVECDPTPGAANNGANAIVNATVNITDVRLSVYIENATVNQTYTSLFKIDIDNKTCTTLDNVTVSYNITPSSVTGSFSREVGCSMEAGSWAPAAAGNYTICGYVSNLSFSDANLSNNDVCRTVAASEAQKQCNTSVSISSESIANGTATLEYRLLLADSMCNETSVDVEYWIEDLFGSYVKAKLNTTQEFSCYKSVDRQWTPDSITGTEAYKIKAVLRTGCQDNVSDNSAEKLIVVKGFQARSALGSSSESSPSNSGSTGASDPKKSMELLSYPSKVYVNEPFETIVNVSASSFSIYSYVYSGNKPVSEWNGKGSWDANRKDLNASGLVVLAKKIENGTEPGNYTMKVRLKSDKEEDIIVPIEVLGRPKLSIEKINSSVLLTACEGCEILILGQDFEFSGKNYTLQIPGVYNVLLLKDSKVFSKSRVVIEEIKNSTSAKITGMTTKKSKRQIDKKHLAMLQVLSKIKLF